MKNWFKISLFVISFSSILQAEEGAVCKKCEKVREYNKAHPENNYEWYDDYLKDKEDGKAKESSIDKDSKKESSLI